MSIDLDGMIDELQETLGLDDDDTNFGDDVLTLLLNRSYWSLLTKFPFRETEATALFTLTAGTNLYVMPNPFEALRQISIEDLDTGKHTALERMTQIFYENTYINKADQNGKPTHYYREAKCAKIWPTPDREYPTILKYLTLLADLEDPSDIPGVPKNWHEIIMYGGIWRGYYRMGDIVRGERMKKLDSTMINEAIPVESKEERDPRAGVEVLLNEYDAR
jgi:hypothetical protein